MTPIFIHIRHTTIYDYSITVYNCVILHTIFNLDTLTYVSPVSDGDPMYVCINFQFDIQKLFSYDLLHVLEMWWNYVIYAYSVTRMELCTSLFAFSGH